MNKKTTCSQRFKALTPLLFVLPLLVLLAIEVHSYYQQIKQDEMVVNTLAIGLREHLEAFRKTNDLYPKSLQDIDFIPVKGIFIGYQWSGKEFDLQIEAKNYSLTVNENGIFDPDGKLIQP